jgi:hypothetical protein
VDTPHTLGITPKKREKLMLKSMEANRSGRFSFEALSDKS